MPRPARRNHRRQNSFTLRSPQSRKPARVPPIPSPADVRQHLETQVAGKPKGKKQGDSDDSDQLVTTRTSARNRKRQDVYASGGVGKGDKPGALPSRAQSTRSMRKDTDEILSQRSRSASRSASRAGSEQSVQPVSTQTPVTKGKKNASSETNSGSRANIEGKKKAIDQSPTNGQVTASILGKIKPRKRQDSILKLIQADGNDESTIMSRDEAEFLPDAVSTPTVANQTQTPQRSSLKRKRGTDLTESVSKQQFTSLLSSPIRERNPAIRSSPEISQPSRSQRRKLTTTSITQEEEDSIMALPESSDSEDDAGEDLPVTKPGPRTSKEDAAVIPSTNTLQNLMPSRKQEPLPKRRTKDAFALPRDSSPSSDTEMNESIDESSAFVPGSARKKQKRVTAQSKTGQSSKKTTNGSKTPSKLKTNAKSTNTTSLATPSPVRVRTPLPLSSVKASTRGTSAKSPSKQGTTIMRDKTSLAVNTPMIGKGTVAQGKSGRKQYGGSRRRGAGKENNPAGFSEESSNGDDTNGMGQSNTNMDQKIEQRIDGPEIKAWKKKWANIDDFQMEIEEVSMSTRSSSPMAR